MPKKLINIRRLYDKNVRLRMPICSSALCWKYHFKMFGK